MSMTSSPGARLRLALGIFISALASLPAVAGTSVNVGDPNNPTGLQAAIYAAYNGGASTITINPGTYNIPSNLASYSSQNGYALWLDHLQNLTINAARVTLNFSDSSFNCIDIRYCANLVFQGAYLTAPGNFTQGTVYNSGQDASGNYYIDVTINAGYRTDWTNTTDWAASATTQDFDTRTHRWKWHMGDYSVSIPPTTLNASQRQYRFIVNSSDFMPGTRNLAIDRNFAYGDTVAIRARAGTCISLNANSYVTLQNITNSIANATQWAASNNDHVWFDHCNFVYQPIPAGGTVRGVLGPDGAQAGGGSTNMTLTNCLWQGSDDDIINYDAATGFTMLNTVFQNSRDVALYLGANADIENCVFDQSTKTAVTNTRPSSSMMIANNVFTNNGVMLDAAIELNGPAGTFQNTTIANNIFIDNSVIGLAMNGATGAKILDNAFVNGHQRDGIARGPFGIQDGQDSTTEIWLASDAGITLSGNLVSNDGPAATSRLAQGSGNSGLIGVSTGVAPGSNTVSYASGATLAGSAVVASGKNSASGSYVTGIGGSGSVTFAVNAPISGQYAILIAYENGSLDAHGNPTIATQSVTVNGSPTPVTAIYAPTPTPGTTFDPTYVTGIYAELHTGRNTLRFASGLNQADLDNITLVAPTTVAGVVSETESLVIPNYSGPSHRNVADPAYSNGNAVILDGTAAGNYITFLVPNVAAGSYDVRVGVKRANSRGTWQLSVGQAANFSGTASNVGVVSDDYSPTDAFAEVDLGNWTPASTSDKWFRFTITGKNANSTNYSESIDYIKLTPQ